MSDPRLIVGGDGLLGRALEQYWTETSREIIATSRTPRAGAKRLVFDLSHPAEKWPAFPKCHAAVLCAGITSLQLCRNDPEGTRRINVTQTLELARRLAEQNCFVLFISSNLVFDGNRPLCLPEDPTSPRTEYGRQKVEVEQGLARLGDRAAVVRLTKVIHRDWSLPAKWLESLRAGKPVSAFADMVCAPVSLAKTVRAIAAIAEERRVGIWHLSAARDISYADIARQLAVKVDANADLVRAVSAGGDPAIEHLPKHTSLNAERSARELPFEIPDPQASIAETFFA